MVQTVLDAIFTPELMTKLGDLAPTVYGWSCFALIVFYCLCCLGGFVTFLRALMRWTR